MKNVPLRGRAEARRPSRASATSATGRGRSPRRRRRRAGRARRASPRARRARAPAPAGTRSPSRRPAARHRVAVGREPADDGRSDPARPAGDERPHRPSHTTAVGAYAAPGIVRHSRRGTDAQGVDRRRGIPGAK